MKIFYKILRAFLLSVIALVLAVPSLLYLGLELDCVQRFVSRQAEHELSKLLDADVTIGSVSFAPFNRAWIRNVVVSQPDSCGTDTVAKIDRLGAGIDLYRLVKGEIVVGYAELIGADIRIHRRDNNSPLNIDPIIKALAPRDTLKPKSRYDLRINSVVLRRSALAYDVDSAQMPDSARFSPSHIAISDLRADIRIPRLSNNNIDVDVHRFAFTERSGFTVENISLRARLVDGILTVTNPQIRLRNTELSFSDISFPVASPDGKSSSDLRSLQLDYPIEASLLGGSTVTPSDFSAFLPSLSPLNEPCDFNFDISGSLNALTLNSFELRSRDFDSEIEIRNCHADSVARGIAAMAVRADHVAITADGPDIARYLSTHVPSVSPKAVALLNNAGNVAAVLSGNLSNKSAKVAGFVTTDAGSVDLDIAGNPFANAIPVKATVSTYDFDFGHLLHDVVPESLGLSTSSFILTADGSLKPKPVGVVDLTIDDAGIYNQNLSDINLHASATHDGEYTFEIDSRDPEALIKGEALLTNTELHGHRLIAELNVGNLNLGLIDHRHPDRGYVHFGTKADFAGHSLDDATGAMQVYSMGFESMNGISKLNSLTLVVNGESQPKDIRLRSDIADVHITGTYHTATLASDVKDIVYALLPSLAPLDYKALASTDERTSNEIQFDATIRSLEQLTPIVKLPVGILMPVDIAGSINSRDRSMRLEIDAPYLRQGNKIIEGSSLQAAVLSDSVNGQHGEMEISTMLPVKKGPTSVKVAVQAFNDNIDTQVNWEIDHTREYSGRLDISTALTREAETSDLMTKLHFNPSRLVFNDTVWTVLPSDIFARKGRIVVDDFEVRGFNGQHLGIKGVASASPSDSLHLTLDRIDLDYIFETLEISNAMFGGRATGNFYAAALLSGAPRLYTDDLYVEGIKYNHCLMGDAKIRSHWNLEEKGVEINADIMGDHDNLSTINGMIKPMSEELDFQFHADDVPVGFLLPFMEAFTSQIDGRASGDAHLYGTFKLLDMTGDLYANKFKMKVDFTNCWYETTDSIHLRPGRIDIPGITLRDMEGHTARFQGYVTHKCFKEPRFDFKISDARDLLVYDVGQNVEQVWYGKIYGNGRASVVGEPGKIDIGVDMSTAPGSTFTFVLSDAEEAYDYTFINFRDRNASIEEEEDLVIPEPVAQLRRKLAQHHENSLPTEYNLKISMQANQNVAVTLVMDPVGGDRIKARGYGDLTMGYSSADEVLDIRGDYTLTQGSYNFTLQDIIIKDFTIDEGSKIEFTGDPYRARLDMKAIYQLNANLTDLDESFSQDKEVGRTNVPVHAILKVSGEISQPEIHFDINFPTLTDDTYRKVKSIISTEDMMNRQMIYLLALNRFYTPEYMTATKGNELVSVASSTISSQLSNILGQLSDNWTIAPNFRSDRGDFSDVEFDLALSSRLLNNRLLLNGNFGYRDKALNNNSFIGDFDLEYLLNRSGTIRLKAYNRYNDRNFYIKSALTTQGVGVMYRVDFDDMFDFLRKRPKLPVPEAKPDSIRINPNPSSSQNEATQ